MINKLVKNILAPWWRARGKKPIWQQLREILRLVRLYRASPRQYFSCILYVPGHVGQIEDYLPLGRVEAYRDTINPAAAAPLLNDKLKFFRTAHAAGLRVSPVLAISDGQGGLLDAEGAVLSADALDVLRQAHGGQLFCKPLKGAAGQGVEIAASLDDIRRTAQNTAVMMYQPVLKQHPDLAAFNPSSVNSIRIDTLDTGDQIVTNLACLKIGMGGALVDNGGLGGFFVGVDMDSGRLNRIATQRAFISTDKFERHPDSGLAFDGACVPHWEALKAEVLRAAEVFRPLGSIGWDVAVTVDGPVIIEGNVGWSTTLSQNAAGGLAPTEFGRRAIAHMKTR